MKEKKIKCPREKQLVKAFLGELADEEKMNLVDHVFTCPECRLKFNLLKKLGKELRPQEGKFEGKSLTSEETRALKKMAGEELYKLKTKKQKSFLNLLPSSLAARIALGAAALLLIFLSFALISLLSPPRETLRSGKEQKLELIAPKGKIQEPPVEFIWTRVQHADAYEFKLIDDELQTLVEQSKIKTSRYNLPQAIGENLKKGRIYIWSIKAIDDSGYKLDSNQEYFEIE
jgi:hypothetical protein